MGVVSELALGTVNSPPVFLSDHQGRRSLLSLSQRKTSINPNVTSLGGDRSSALGIVS